MGLIRDYIAGRTQSLGGGKEEEVGIAGFSLFARINESVEFNSNSVNAVVEDGSFLTDHIINDPIVITVSGEVSDIFLKPRALLPTITRDVSQVVQAASPFIPNRTAAQINRIRRLGAQANELIQRADQVVSLGRQAYDLVERGQRSKGIEEQFVDYMTGIREAKNLIDIETKFKVYRNYAINALVFERDNATNSTRFRITAKEVRIASLLYTDATNFFKNAGSFTPTVAGESNKGTQVPRGERSLLSTVRGIFGG